MKSLLPKALLICLSAFGLAACQNNQSSEVGHGKIISLGPQKLILQNKAELLFVDIPESDRERLSELQKGEHVTLLGTMEVSDSGHGDFSESADIDEVVQDNGHHIRLGVR
jgi:hypothetical protein